MSKTLLLSLFCLLLTLPFAAGAKQVTMLDHVPATMQPAAHHHQTAAAECSPMQEACEEGCWQCSCFCTCCHLTAPLPHFAVAFIPSAPITLPTDTPADIQRPRIPELPPPLS